MASARPYVWNSLSRLLYELANIRTFQRQLKATAYARLCASTVRNNTGCLSRRAAGAVVDAVTLPLLTLKPVDAAATKLSMSERTDL